jgi:hypothetical protein
MNIRSTLASVGLVGALIGALLAFQGVRTVGIAFFDPLESDTEIDQLLMTSPAGPTYKAVRTYFPTEAAYWRERTAEVLKGDANDFEKSNAAIEIGAAIRRRNAPSLANAPDAMLVKVLNHQIGLIAEFRDAPETCNTMLMQGPAALSKQERNALISHIQSADVLYEAMHAGQTAPVDRTAATTEDWQALMSAMSEAGLTEEEIALIAEPDPNDARLCQAMLGFLDTIRSASFPGADRLRAEMAVSMLGS